MNSTAMPSFFRGEIFSTLVKFFVPVAVGLAIAFSPAPESLNPKGWHLFAIFVGTIVGLIFKPLPMGPVSLIGLAVAAMTGTLDMTQSLSGFSSPIIWLIVYVFFIARGFIKTQLGSRIAFYFVSILGRSTLGLSYGLTLTELLIAPLVPSNGARAGGIILPILRSLSESLGSSPEQGTERKVGGFLTQVAMHTNLVTSSMFLTAMAANPLAQIMAAKQGIAITWGNWALAACVPGLVSLLVIPLVIYFVYPPELKHIPGAVSMAQSRLQEMGRMSSQEWIMSAIFLFMLVLWIAGDSIGVSSASTALMGLCLLLCCKVLTWDDVLQEREAWNTFIWFPILVTMARFLEDYGFIAWFSGSVAFLVKDLSWKEAFGALLLIYYYSHYFFASATAHASAMYAAFLAVAIGAGTPPLLAALTLGFCNSLFAHTTHYGSSPAVFLYATRYVSVGHWWTVGLIISIVSLLVWGGVGLPWWKFIGIW